MEDEGDIENHADRFALDVAGCPFGGLAHDADGFFIEDRSTAAENVDIRDAAVFLNGELQSHATLEGIFDRLLGIMEIVVDPVGELADVTILEAGLGLQQGVFDRFLRRRLRQDFGRRDNRFFGKRDYICGRRDALGKEQRRAGQQREEEQQEEFLPGRFRSSLHHRNTVFELGVVEAVGQEETLFPHGFFHE